MTTNDQTSDWSTETQIQRNEIDFQIDDKTTILHLSNAVNVITTNLMQIIVTTGATYADDLDSITYPLTDIISFVWSTPSDESFEENLYFLFDKILDIVYCTYEILDDVWHGSTFIIEAKLSQISLYVLRVVDEMKALSESGWKMEFVANLEKVNQTIVELAVALVGLTAMTTSIAQSIATRDRNVFLIAGAIASLLMIHQYAIAAVACLLSRAVQVVDSLDIIHAAGIAALETIIVNFISNMQQIVLHKYRGATITQLFHGDEHSKLSMQLLTSVKELIGSRMVSTIHNTMTSMLHIIEEYAPKEFHVLPDLLDQLIAVLVQCGRTEFRRLEPFITYAFDGLNDILHHISYKLNRHIQSSASTGSFPEPSEPIDVALATVRTLVKRFLHDTQHTRSYDDADLNLIASTADLMKALVDPMNIIIQKSDDDFSITLSSSLQFVALYVTGLITTPFIAAGKSLSNFSAHVEMYATLSLALIKIQMIFEYSHMYSTSELMQRLCDCFDDLFQDLSRLDTGTDDTVRTTTSRKVNSLLHLLL